MSGPATARLSRLLALVPWLLAHDGVGLAECAAHFAVSEEQLERDLWLLVVCGVPGYGPDQLVDIQFWDDGRVHVLDPQTLDRPLRLTQDEGVTLLVALRMLAQLPGIEDRSAIASAAAKIEQATDLIGSDRLVAIDVGVDPGVSAAVGAALAGSQALAIRYAGATRDEITDRTIDPLRLFTTDGVSYLEAHCRSAGAVRTFRLDRVLSATPAGPADAGPEPEPAATPPEMGRAPDQLAVLALDPSARWIIDVYGARVRAGTGVEDGRVEVELPLHSMEWGTRLVLSLAGSARVVEPPSLASAVAQAARLALAAYPDHIG